MRNNTKNLASQSDTEQSAKTVNPNPVDLNIDKHLDAILKASGSGLRYFTMAKTLDDMRNAMLDFSKTAIEAHLAAVRQAPAAPSSALAALSTENLYRAATRVGGKKGSNETIGVWSGTAANEEEATRKAMHSWSWVSELNQPETDDLKTRIIVSSVPRYIASKHWSHIFIGQTESMTRWVIDRSTNMLVDAQISGPLVHWTNRTGGWSDLDQRQAADLAESLRHNDVGDAEDGSEDYEFTNKAPDWARNRLAVEVSCDMHVHINEQPAALPDTPGAA